MAESAAGSWAQFAGVEIVNDERTTAYLLNGLRPPSINVSGNCGCENTRQLVGCDDPYTDPVTDNAPWYSADRPESARFAGFLVTEFDGMGSTFTRDVTESILDGGVLGRGRRGSRSLTWKGLLLGADCCAVAYGLRWLAKTLAGGSGCRDCAGNDLEILVCCPDSGSFLLTENGDPIITESGDNLLWKDLEEVGVEPFRILKNVALVEGPEIVQNHKLGCGCGASCITEVEFTLVAAQPFLYSPPIPIYDCVDLVSNSIPSLIDVSLEECTTDSCGSAVEAQFCAPPILPPTATYSNDCFFDTLDETRSLFLTVPRSSWGSLEEVVPVISITTGGAFITQLWIRFYYNANDDPCGDVLGNVPLCNTSCDPIKIYAIPDHSTFYIDGRTRKMSLICDSINISPGEKFTSGPWSWPVFDCFGFCMEVLYYSGPTDPAVSDICVSLSLVPRTN